MTQAIFDGPPAFILFGFMMLIAAYLRQLFGAIEGLINHLNQGIAPYPFHKTEGARRQKLMETLEDIRGQLRPLTHLMFFLILLLAVRIFVYSLLPIGVELQTVKIWFDFAFSICIVVLISIMWIMHTRAVKLTKKYESPCKPARTTATERT